MTNLKEAIGSIKIYEKLPSRDLIAIYEAARLDIEAAYRQGVEDGKKQSPAHPAIPEDVRKTLTNEIEHSLIENEASPFFKIKKGYENRLTRARAWLAQCPTAKETP